MKTFKQIIFEAKAVPTAVEGEEKLKHIQHPEERLFSHGRLGAEHALGVLRSMHDGLSGQKVAHKFGIKYDGAPSIVFGYHPETGRFFVASKSAFNKNPKINYTRDDIVQNHGHAPGLVDKLSAALEHLPKVTPRGHIYQGDIMHTPGDISDDKKKLSFTPNTITYSIDKKNPEAKKIQNSQIGVAIHTKYEPGSDNSLESHRPRFMPDLNKMKQHPDVHVISTEAKFNPEAYTDAQKAEFHKHMSMAEDMHNNTGEETYSAIQPHSETLSTYINHEVRRNGIPNHKDFMEYVRERGQKEISKLKSASAIQRKTELHNATLADIKNKKKHFDKAFQLHNHIQSAKNVLASAFSNNEMPYEHSIGSVPSKPEGAVSVDPNNVITKVIDRGEFSAANFGGGKFQKQTTQD
jgi:hypothetical protein